MEEETESVSVSPKLMARDEGWDILRGRGEWTIHLTLFQSAQV